MGNNMIIAERILLSVGFLFGAYFANDFIMALQAPGPSMVNEIIMTVFGGVLGAGGFYAIAGSLWLMFKLTVLCKNLLMVPSEE